MRRRNDGVQFFITTSLVLISAAFNYGISLVLTQYITNRIGAEAYGFVTFAKTFANYATVITVAINAVATRFITIEYHKGQYDVANTYYSTLFFANLLLSCAILVISFFVINNLEKVLTITVGLVYDVKTLFSLSIINICILSLGTVFNSATYINNRLDYAAIFKIAAYSVEAIAMVFLFTRFGPRIQFVGIALVLSSIVLVVENYGYGRQVIKELKVKRCLFKFSAIKKVFSTGIWYSINSLGNMLNSGLDLWITNLLLSSLQMGQLAIVKTVTTIEVALFQLTSQPFQPYFMKYYANNDIEKLTTSLKYAMKTNGFLSNVLFAFLSVFGLYYYNLWTPSEDINLLAIITFISIIGTLIEGIVTPLYFVYVLTLKNKIPCIVSLVSGLLNVTFMYILIRNYSFGIEIVVGTTTVLSWVINFVFTPFYVARCLKIHIKEFYSPLLRNIASAIFMVLVFKLLSIVIHPESWCLLIITGVVCTIIGIFIHYGVALTKKERKQVVQSVRIHI